MSNAEYVKAVLLTCPHITAGPFDMAIDFLDSRPMRYSIEAEPTAQIIKSYLGGATVRSFAFALVARCPVQEDEARAANAQHYEELSLWLEQQTRRRALPAMGEGATPRSMAAIGNPYVIERAEDGDTATYMMQIQLIYDQKARG